MRRRKADLVVWQAASWCLSYPDEDLLARLPMITRALADHRRLEPFQPLLTRLAERPLTELQPWHVREFDMSRRHALHLTYWTDGDTRRRGTSLTRIKQAYRDSGLLVDTHGELPDHLPMVLEFAAVGDPKRGRQLLIEFRPSLELLRMACERDDLPHAGVVRAVCDTLPGQAPRDRSEALALINHGPQVETVGLEPYGAGLPPGDPRLLPQHLTPASGG
ncbi:nitrate reductase molybdenum cofactor assembly chaperone [Propionibacteriaceae bacterium Y2011]|uniref:nitrate reductase molybdenum cofactor assembly chaperone n=1 Tax=Microlunatus sp. Y2014 TaxID=3418488 RepID=UPI003B4939C2